MSKSTKTSNTNTKGGDQEPTPDKSNDNQGIGSDMGSRRKNFQKGIISDVVGECSEVGNGQNWVSNCSIIIIVNNKVYYY